jgi:glycosyl transferase family 25
MQYIIHYIMYWDNVYVIHYTPLTDRRVHMEKQLSKHGITGKFITTHDRDDINELKQFIIGPNFNHFEVSLYCKHIEALKRVSNGACDYAIIFEDDVTLYDDFKIKFDKYFIDLSKEDNWDFLFFGSGWNLHVPTSIYQSKNCDTNVFLKTNQGTGTWSPLFQEGWPICAGSTRCADSYMITKSAASKILKHLENKHINSPFDIHMNQVFRDLSMSVYWAEPSLCKQDTFKSSIKLS